MVFRRARTDGPSDQKVKDSLGHVFIEVCVFMKPYEGHSGRNDTHCSKSDFLFHSQ